MRAVAVTRALDFEERRAYKKKLLGYGPLRKRERARRAVRAKSDTRTTTRAVALAHRPQRRNHGARAQRTPPDTAALACPNRAYR
jgi:hypothetical protein